MDKLFGSDSLLSRQLTDYEPRPGQLEMAKAVHRLLTLRDDSSIEHLVQSDCLAVEAETGLGKTLAYLIPAVLCGRKIVVSTNTRNLQDQILKREIPFIQEHLAPDLQALCVKGRQNYLCRYRFNQSLRQKDVFPNREQDDLNAWLSETTYGDRSELGWLPAHSPLWQKICCQTHFCLGNDCPDGSSCFLNRLRRDAAASQLLIVNHHLLFSDLAVRKGGYGEVLPRYEAVIFDEAHHIENVATAFFGSTFSKYQVLDLIGDVERSVAAAPADAQHKPVLAAARELAGLIDRFTALFPEDKGRFPLDQPLQGSLEISQHRDHLLASLSRLTDTMEKLNSADEPWQQYANRSHDLAARLEMITVEQFDDLPPEELKYTYWYERTEKNLSLSATPVDVASDLQETLFASVASCIFTSATLTTGGDFSYFLKRLGLPEETQTLSFVSPFDYPGRTLLYFPEKQFPEPASPGYQQALHNRIASLVNHARGRALLLFTSFQAMNNAYEGLCDQLDYPMMVQGEAPRHALLKRFTADTHSVLFAVSSFWEGVDIPGESLSLLIIDKLPFEVPSDPVIMARINRIKAQGGNPFFDFQIPRAILSLRQGVGRLMRTSSDRGVICILDVRLFTKGYGRRFLKSLPPSPICRTEEQVANFFT